MPTCKTVKLDLYFTLYAKSNSKHFIQKAELSTEKDTHGSFICDFTPQVATGVSTLDHLPLFFLVHQQLARPEMEKSGLKLLSVWDPDMTGRLTSYATTSRPQDSFKIYTAGLKLQNKTRKFCNPGLSNYSFHMSPTAQQK